MCVCVAAVPCSSGIWIARHARQSAIGRSVRRASAGLHSVRATGPPRAAKMPSRIDTLSADETIVDGETIRAFPSEESLCEACRTGNADDVEEILMEWGAGRRLPVSALLEAIAWSHVNVVR